MKESFQLLADFLPSFPWPLRIERVKTQVWSGMASSSIVDGTAVEEAAGIVGSSTANKEGDATNVLVREKSREFPLGDSPSLGPQSTVNPFHEPKNESVLQLLKTLLLLPLFLLRVVCLVTLMALGYVFIRLALLGVSDPLFKPFNRFRRTSLWTVRAGARAVLFTMGYYYIPVKGRPAHRSQAPIIVCNHISFVDPIFVFYRHLPVIVSAKENVEMPIVGVFLKALQVKTKSIFPILTLNFTARSSK